MYVIHLMSVTLDTNTRTLLGTRTHLGGNRPRQTHAHSNAETHLVIALALALALGFRVSSFGFRDQGLGIWV